MSTPILIAKNDSREIFLLPQMANRHGLITGATGTGKTVTLQSLAEQFSSIGVPCFMSDIKGDLSGVAVPGGSNEKVAQRIKDLGIAEHRYQGFPVTFWDTFGEYGHPIRTTVSDIGPLLLSRMLELNETQAGVLNLVFKVADDQGLLLLDLKDLRAMLQFVGGITRKPSPRSMATCRPPASGRSSAASLRLRRRGARRSSVSRCWTSTT